MEPFPTLANWSRQIQLPGSKINLHYFDTGDNSKPPVLLLHGLGDEADTWRHVIPLLQPGYRVIAPDLPGFGRSEKGKRDYSIPFFIDTLLELLNFLSITRTILVGHSMGAMIAQALALKDPQRVERLVLISGSMVSRRNRFDLGLVLFLIPGVGERLYNQLRKNPQEAYRTLEPYYYSLGDLPQEDRDFLFKRVNERVWSDGQRQGYLSALRNMVFWVSAQQKSLPARLEGWNIPTLAIWGEKDRVMSIENAHDLIRLIPSAQLVIVPEAGHNVQQEKAEAVASAIQ
jgi:pimeloyl-ACP methyl ester carboxylesterase